MKNDFLLDIDYRKNVIQLIKTEYPLFALGLFVILFMSFIIVRSNIMSLQMLLKPRVRIQNNTTQTINKMHVVSEGEDLWQIAEKYYGSGYNAFDIATKNNLKEPYVLNKGQKLIIPRVAKRIPTQGEITGQSAATTQVKFQGNIYVVKPGEYLFQIAQDIYGDGNMMNKIIDANNIPYPYDIQEGEKLQIPR
ncbi:hypothetical protein COY90_00145 [Candidatus Roizmanbacteria bacterium CG_4_10_14_0_8_um_filter_39_9]|uniref:LysM domain-containing protein n=1 Tax=Candidatus Roizmanbacteria bacterium CG_4_10_14_0_8_um_filter_39_9 TaxID=1974829 RepID=A0A2M7QF48_9BACT|nr:MAG: hypothetical protein COY90_00145 [Candidatus Roizmanbacteria bacterium CG_4_10_14_0_8_um_filter_39_9]